VKKNGLECDPASPERGHTWPEGHTGHLQESDVVVLQLIHPDRIDEVEELYQSWKSRNEAGA
jgi:hypothetical protein